MSEETISREDSNPHRVGLWLAGARGDIATTVICGARAIAHGVASATGLVTELPPLNALGCTAVAGLRFGGVEISAGSLPERARRLQHASRTLSPEVLDAISADLAGIDRDISTHPGLQWDPADPSPSLPPLAELVDAISTDIAAFRDRHALDRVIVVNLISAAPLTGESDLQDTADGIAALVAGDRKDLFSPSAAYAYAALRAGHPFLNFTPNPESRWPGFVELAGRTGSPYAGDDGKTGETLVKTALAPMFAHRNLRVLSWEGVNMLGNEDGRTLDHPRNKQSKLANKEEVLPSILGYQPHADVAINYVPSLGDWKTAWDLIHFRGFLDVAMSMQFTWQGCDSILAAPLVLDLARLLERAARDGASGPQTHLACFFKHPLGVAEMDFHRQFELLLDYVSGRVGTGTDAARP